MTAATVLAANDEAKLVRLHNYEVPAAIRRQACQRLTRLAVALFGVQAISINLLDKSRQWFRTFDAEVTEQDHGALQICAEVVSSGTLVSVLDALDDERFARYPAVNGERVRFYAGVPLRTTDGCVLGTLSILDSTPRSDFSSALAATLDDLGQTVVEWLELQKSVMQLSRLAFHDALTGLPNRRVFRDRVRQAMAAADRDGAKVAVAMIDLDNFKTVNDTRGHEAGDALLKQIATLLSGAIRSRDTVARWGGDEFVCCLTVADRDELDALMQRLTEAFNQTEAEASIGVAVYPDDAASLASLMKVADRAMYRMKRSDVQPTSSSGGTA